MKKLPLFVVDMNGIFSFTGKWSQDNFKKLNNVLNKLKQKNYNQLPFIFINNNFEKKEKFFHERFVQ